MLQVKSKMFVKAEIENSIDRPMDKWINENTVKCPQGYFFNGIVFQNINEGVLVILNYAPNLPPEGMRQ